jgi:hypothetical protein
VDKTAPVKHLSLMSGSVIHDFFMGATLNPRLLGGRLDLKMWSELRISWLTLFVLTLSAAAKQRRDHGWASETIKFKDALFPVVSQIGVNVYAF